MPSSRSTVRHVRSPSDDDDGGRSYNRDNALVNFPAIIRFVSSPDLRMILALPEEKLSLLKILVGRNAMQEISRDWRDCRESMRVVKLPRKEDGSVSL